MDEPSTTNKKRKAPGPAFFLAALFVYLCVVHGVSLLSTGPRGPVAALSGESGMPQILVAVLNGFLEKTGYSPAIFSSFALALLYACMICIFQITRHLVKGPVWLGSLAAAVFMAHPAKTEVLFSAVGLIQLLSALSALLSIWTCLRLLESRSIARYLIALMLFAVASFPFPANATLFGLVLMLEFYPGTPETRRWSRLVPFLLITIVANGLHLNVLYSRSPDLAENFAPLLLLIYPIGLLPSTVVALQTAPLISWGWGLLAAVLVVTSMVYVRNGAYRVCVLALLAFRFYPGALPIDLSTLNGAGQLLVPIAFGAVALAGFCRWSMQFEAWGRTTVAWTTMLCIVLFVLQFQANRAQVKDSVPHVAHPGVVAAVEGEGRG